MSSAFSRFEVLGVGIHALSLNAAVDCVLEAARLRQGGYACFCTAHGLVEARRNPALRAAYAGSRLSCPDGMPLVWLGRHRGFRDITRVYGPDLMLAVCDRGRALGLRHYFYGGLPGVAAALADRLKSRFPGIELAGWRTPPLGLLDEAEICALRSSVSSSRPDLLWVGLGAPRQELFMAEQAPLLAAGFLLGVGAAFDFHSGRVPQAPVCIRRSGFEWLYRLAREPRRLGPRTFNTVPAFALAYLGEWFKKPQINNSGR